MTSDLPTREGTLRGPASAICETMKEGVRKNSAVPHLRSLLLGWDQPLHILFFA